MMFFQRLALSWNIVCQGSLPIRCFITDEIRFLYSCTGRGESDNVSSFLKLPVISAKQEKPHCPSPIKTVSLLPLTPSVMPPDLPPTTKSRCPVSLTMFCVRHLGSSSSSASLLKATPPLLPDLTFLNYIHDSEKVKCRYRHTWIQSFLLGKKKKKTAA